MRGRYADKTIVLVEETRFFRETVEEALRGAGFRVLAAATAPKGRQLLEAEGHRVDLLVLDLHLSPVDGFDLLEHLRHLEPLHHPPILAMLLGLEIEEAVQQLRGLEVVGVQDKRAAFAQIVYRVAALVNPRGGQERATVRVPLGVPVNYTVGRWQSQGIVFNLSKTGIFLSTDLPVEAGHRLQLQFILPGVPRLFELSGQKILALEKSWDPAKGTPVFTVRGRYTAGRTDGRDIPAYVDEDGVDPNRETETFAQVSLWIDNWRWAGVPFILRSGKALQEDRREIAIHFKPVPHLAFVQESTPQINVLRLELNPDRLALGVNINGPGDPFDLEYIELDTDLAPQETSAYGRLLLDLLRGDLTHSIRDDEAEESWRIVEPILEAWGRRQVPLLEYPAGSAGPNPTTFRVSKK